MANHSINKRRTIRSLGRLSAQTFDVLVIGGGITGAYVAWDATIRGLRVALVERGDFGAATSANSLKTVHGGLRYLQDGNLRLVRTMIKERKAFLRTAPHLVHPLPVLMPTYSNKLKQSKLILGAGVKVNDLVSLDRNWEIDPSKALPSSRVLSRNECLEQLPGIEKKNLSGGVLWYDAQIYNSERMVLSILLSAAKAGAEVANYVCATDFLKRGDLVAGVRARDELTGADFIIRANVTVNTAGPWIDEVLDWLKMQAPARKFHPSRAMNIVTRQLFPKIAVGLNNSYLERLSDGSAEKRSRVLFFAPWRDYSLIGTMHTPCERDQGDRLISDAEVDSFISEINATYPPARLKREDVHFIHKGYLPALPGNASDSSVKLLRSGQIHDHETESGIAGLITVVGVKYTTARYMAEKAVDLVFKKKKRNPLPCQTASIPIHGGLIDNYQDFINQASAHAKSKLPEECIRPLLYNHGNEYQRILNYAEEDASWGKPVSPLSTVIRAEIIHAMRYEMAQKLTDTVLRRTELGSAGPPDEESLINCAQIMASELEWDAGRTTREIEETYRSYTL
jgi:glycerol-3-phosphate dehydrogenase